MYIRYNGYTHENNECALVISRETVQAGENILVGIRERWDITGMLFGASAGAITGAIQALEAAYSADYGDIALYTESGGATAHGVLNADTLDGVHVVKPPSFPEGKGAEYATYRTYTIALEWVVPDTGYRLISWAESIQRQGGGVDWGFLTTLNGLPQAQTFAQNTPYTVTQKGRAVGWEDYPTPPSPIWPAAMHQPSSQTTMELPKGSGQERIITWSYTFHSAIALAGQPTVVVPP